MRRQDARTSLTTILPMNITKIFSTYNLVALITVAMLSACGGSFNDKVDEVFNESKIISVNVDPNPAPQPVGNTPTPITLRVKVDSKSTLDAITVNVKDPSHSNQFSMLAYPRPCLQRAEACGVITYEIQCLSHNAASNNGLRTLSCGDVGRAVTLPPGTHPMLVEIRHLGVVSVFTKFIDDSIIVNFVIQ